MKFKLVKDQDLDGLYHVWVRRFFVWRLVRTFGSCSDQEAIKVFRDTCYAYKTPVAEMEV